MYISIDVRAPRPARRAIRLCSQLSASGSGRLEGDLDRALWFNLLYRASLNVHSHWRDQGTPYRWALHH